MIRQIQSPKSQYRIPDPKHYGWCLEEVRDGGGQKVRVAIFDVVILWQSVRLQLGAYRVNKYSTHLVDLSLYHHLATDIFDRDTRDICICSNLELAHPNVFEVSYI